MMIVAPRKPPVAAVPVKASEKIVAKAAGISPANITRTTTTQTM